MSKALATKNVAAVLLAVSLIAGFAFAFATPAKADTVSDLQAQVQALLAQISGLQGGNSSSSGGACFTFTQNLKMGSSGGEVMWLQKFLNGHGFAVSATGAGSPGNESSYFGGLTKAAVIAFQNANKADILTPVGLTSGTGNWFASTRAKANAMCAGSPGNPTPVPTGPGISISASSQPANTLAPQGASRVPFTTFTLTNNTSQVVTINSVTVQRTGLAQDAAFSGVVLLDQNGLQVGISHTFNSNHQTNIGDNFTLAPGTSMTFTVAGNMAASLSSYAGQVASMQVVGVNTTVPVSGSLPISGASQTLNASLSTGTVSTSTSSFDPGGAQTKKIGDVGVRFTGLRFTAGSTEDLKLYSIRWRQTGTASSQDIGNIMTVVNGTSYPTTMDASGKYYTTVFPSGILIAKGNAIDIYVQGDITGSNAANRTVEFDIDKSTDSYFVGQLYGYGVTDRGCSGSTQCTNTPWYTGYVTTINGGTATAIQNATSVPAANVPVAVPNTTLGGFQTNFQGESVTVSAIRVTVASSSQGTAVINPLSSVSIVDSNGTVVAGPVDQSGSLLTFTDSVTFPTGLHTYTLKGKIASGVGNGTTFTLSTVPSTQWTSPTGQITGNTVTLPSSTVTMSVQTVQAGSLTITASPTPVAANIVAGVIQQTLGTIQLDASQSGEDIRLASLPVSIIVSATANATDLNSCLIYDGSTVLNNNSTVNPSSSTTATSNTTGAKNTFTFDNALTVSKGTVKNLTVKCNIVSGASLTSVAIGVHASNTYASNGVQSGASITPTATTGASGTQTISASGTLTATAASTAVSQPALSRVSAGTLGVVQGFVKLHATKEAINVTKIAFTLNNGTYGTASTGSGGSANAGANDVVTAYIYDGATQVGTVTFTGTTAPVIATSTLSTPVNVAQDSDVTLTIKVDLATIGFSASGGIGDTVKVDPLEIYSNGVASGASTYTVATAGVNGVQMFKSVPTIASIAGTCANCAGTGQVLKAFTVKADLAGSVSVEQLKFNISTSTNGATVTNALVQVYDQNNNLATSTFSTQKTTVNTGDNTFAGGPVIVPGGSTYTFKLIGDVTSGSNQTWNVNVTLKGDASAISGIGTSPAMIGTTTSVANSSSFVWSDNATTTAALTDVDWFNGFQVNGLPSSGL